MARAKASDGYDYKIDLRIYVMEDAKLPTTTGEYLKPVLEELAREIRKTNPDWKPPTYDDGIPDNRALKRLCGLASR